MGKIVKYCNSCDEGFAERFGFCPDCGAPLQAFEMNPLDGQPELEQEAFRSEAAFAAEPEGIENIQEEAVAEEPVEIFEASDVDPEPEDDVFDPSTVEVAEPSIPTPIFVQTTPSYADEHHYLASEADGSEYDGGYHITVIQEKGVKQRNLLLLGSAILMLTLSVGATIVSLFQKDLGVGAIGDERSLALLIDEVPTVIEEEEVQKEKDKGGGGGGGGEEEENETSQGDLADQTEQPIRPPDVRTYRSDNFELKVPVPTTQGNRDFEQKYNRWGDPNSTFAGLSNGPGSGGGQGTGIGTGQGSGSGTGAGSGTGSGSGGGSGSGNGDGDGPGGRGAPPPKVAAVTTPYRIISKPKATYTDAARTNQVQGSVRLKVTLLASGQVGSITPVTRLPHGLTEQAIAAARQIRFEPKKVNGVAQSVVVTFDYGFNIY